MGIEEVERIKKIFSKLNLNPEYLEHEEVITSEDAAKTRGFELKQGIKALLFTNEQNNFVIVNIPADKKVDIKKVALQMGWQKSKIKMASEEEVLEQTNCKIGAVPPFGHKNKITILVDREIYNNDESAFNIGLRTKSVKIKTQQMRILFNNIESIEGEFTKL